MSTLQLKTTINQGGILYIDELPLHKGDNIEVIIKTIKKIISYKYVETVN